MLYDEERFEKFCLDLSKGFSIFIVIQSFYLLGAVDLHRSAEDMGLLGCESMLAFLHVFGQVEN